MHISRAALGELIREMHGIRLDQAGPLDARIKYLQRAGFPDRRPVTRGTKEGYDLQAVLQILLAFQLSDAGIAPARAVRAARHYEHLAWEVCGDAWAFEQDGGEVDRVPMLMMEPQAMGELGAVSDEDGPPIRLWRVPREWLRLWLDHSSGSQVPWEDHRDGSVRPSMLTLLDPIRLVRGIRLYVPTLCECSLADLDAAFERTRASVPAARSPRAASALKGGTKIQF